jgi:predicted RNA-binding protein with PIN domain
MVFLIDGYNLLAVSGVFPKGAPTFANARRALLDYLARELTEDEAAKTTVVFDAAAAPAGLPRELSHRGMKILFAPKDRDADDVIEELIRAASAPRRLTVVSSDHRIQRAAKRRMARAIDSDLFRLELAERRRKKKLPAAANEAAKPDDRSAGDAEDWIAIFNSRATDRATERATEPIDAYSDSPFPPEFFV